MVFGLEKQDYGHFATLGGWMDGWMDAEFGPWFINPITCSQANIEIFFATLYCWSHILR